MTTSVPPIRIPFEYLPRDGRFGSGPSKVRQEAVNELAEIASAYLGTSHRRPAVKERVALIRRGLLELFSAPSGYEVLLGNGGATAFWDAAAFSLISRRSQHLVFGEFSTKFGRAVAGTAHLEAPELIEAPPGTHPDPVVNPEVDVYALTHNETSTGVRMRVVRPDPDGLVVVDGTSAAGALRVDAGEFDVYYFSPQKAFGSDGGLWLAVCSPAAIARIDAIAGTGRSIPAFLSLKIALDNSRLEQTYNTPALATLYLLARQIDWLLDQGGLEWAADRVDRNAAVLFGWAEGAAYASPFVSDPAQRSPVTATIDFDQAVDAATVSAVLRANGILDTEAYRKLGRNQIRVALWPTVDLDDVEALTRSIDYVVEQLG